MDQTATQTPGMLSTHAAVNRHPDWTWGGSLSSIGCAEYARKAIKLSGVPRLGTAPKS